jgi:hypothetical protein
VNAVALHWATRIRVEFVGHSDLVDIADQLMAGNGKRVYEENKHLGQASITKVPGRPLKLYFLKEMVLDLQRFYH